MPLQGVTDLWRQTAGGIAGAQTTVNQPAAAAGVRNVIQRMIWAIGAGAAAAQGPLRLRVIDGVTGGAALLFAAVVAAPVAGQVLLDKTLNIPGSPATQMTVETFAGDVQATAIPSVTSLGYTIP
jgi:hypothetical protein